jgi:uncharacterized protein YciI
MQFIYKLEPTRREMLTTGPTDSEASILADHFNYLERLVSLGQVHLAGRTLDSAEQVFGLVILYAESSDGAAELMAMDPAVEHGVMTAELFPFRISLCASPEALHE